MVEPAIAERIFSAGAPESPGKPCELKLGPRSADILVVLECVSLVSALTIPSLDRTGVRPIIKPLGHDLHPNHFRCRRCAFGGGASDRERHGAGRNGRHNVARHVAGRWRGRMLLSRQAVREENERLRLDGRMRPQMLQLLWRHVGTLSVHGYASRLGEVRSHRSGPALSFG